LAARTSAGRDLLAEGGALLVGAGVGEAHVAASFPWAGGRGAGARRLRPVPRLSSAVRRGAGGGGRGTVVGGPDRPGSPVRGGRSSGQVEDHGPTRAGRAPPVPGRSWAAGPRGARTTGLAGRAPRSSRLVSGPRGSWPVGARRQPVRSSRVICPSWTPAPPRGRRPGPRGCGRAGTGR